MNDSNLAITSRNENFWEQRKLGEIGKIQSCKRIYRNQTSSKGEIPFYKIGTFGKEADSFISRKLYEEYKEKFSFPQIGDILISASGTLGRTVVYNGENAYFQDSNIVWIDNDNHLALNKYLEIYYQRIHWKASEGSTIKRLYNSDIERTIISIPKRDEQAELSKCLKLLNKVITLYERKLKLLSQVKKYFLDNLFAEKESPNLRFKGYEDTWLKSKFSKFLSIPEKEKVTIDSPSRILTVKLNLGGVQKGANRTTLKLNSTTYYLRKAGQLIYGKQNLFNGSLAIIPPQFEGYVTSGDVPSLNIDNINKQFLYYYIARKSFYEKTEAYSSGTGSKRIHEKTFLSFNIVYPENLKEQEKISRLISSINSNIKLYCSKKNKLTAIKKKLLNTMFI